MTKGFAFRVLDVQYLATLDAMLIAAEILEGNVAPGDRAIAVLPDGPILLVIQSVALEGGRNGDDSTVTLQVSVQGCQVVERLKGLKFTEEN